MSVTITQSRRKYLTIAEYTEFTGLVTTLEKINIAEELIDSYVGFHGKSNQETIVGRVASGTASTFQLEASRHQNTFQADWFQFCEVQIIKGTGAGQHRTIASSTLAGIITVDDNFDTTPDATSYYRIFQPGKFPRNNDDETYFDGYVSPQVYIKQIPEAIKRATAAQIQYMTELGDSFFNGEGSTLDAESIGDYSYSRGRFNHTDGTSLVGPKAKQLLKGYVNRKGRMIVGS